MKYWAEFIVIPHVSQNKGLVVLVSISDCEMHGVEKIQNPTNVRSTLETSYICVYLVRLVYVDISRYTSVRVPCLNH